MMQTVATKERRKVLLWAVPLFLITETVLGILLQTVGGVATRVCSYAAVVLACLFCALFASRSAAYFLTQAALLCTVGADWFLVMCDPREQLPAMIFFSGTQIAYFLRLWLADPSHPRRTVHLSVRAALSVLALLVTALVLGEKTDALALVSMFYYVNLLLNVIFAFLEEGISLLSVGLVLFALCDTLIGISCLDPYLPLPEDSFVWEIIHPGFDLAWAFYLPSQALLSMSLWKGVRS